MVMETVVTGSGLTFERCVLEDGAVELRVPFQKTFGLGTWDIK